MKRVVLPTIFVERCPLYLAIFLPRAASSHDPRLVSRTTSFHDPYPVFCEKFRELHRPQI